VFGLIAAGILLLFFFKFRLDQRFRNIVRRVRCPASWRRTEQTVVRDARTGELTGVVSCSEFANPTGVTCDQACLKSPQPSAAVPPKSLTPATR
jgi:hypothetical protein